MAENETAQQASPAAAPKLLGPQLLMASPAAAPKLLGPQLLMAARRGDIEQLKHLLQLKEENNYDNNVTVVTVAVPNNAAATKATTADVDGVTTVEEDTLLHVVASCGDDEGFLHCARMIVAEMRQLLEARNRKGDTPLHHAAGAGNANMIACLIDLFASTTDGGNNDAGAAVAFLRTQNDYGETALHHAVRAANHKVACIDRLMDVDPELACIPHEDGHGVSPLYLAISLGELRIAQHLLDKTRGKLSYSGPDGRNVLHAAVLRGQALSMVVGWLQRAGGVELQLLPLLTIQRDWRDGSTPLHLLAASLGGWPWAQFLSRWLPLAWVPSGSGTIKLLLHANTSAAYEVDNKGLYPIHLAAWAGSLGGVKDLLGECPDCATLRDNKGRTFLHVAVEESRYNVVDYVCRQSQSRRLESRYSAVKYVSSILNAQDNKGDTPLHRAVHAGNLAVLNCLVGNRLVRLDVPNKQGMTPADLALTMIPSEYYILSNQRGYIWVTLQYMGAPCGENRADHFMESQQMQRDEHSGGISSDLGDVIQIMGIVSVLIATVTFASAFTLPGGYRSPADDGPATPVLAGTYAFDAFVLSDALAFICSFLATFSLFYAGSPSVADLSIRLWYINTAALLLLNSGRSLVVAFALAFYMVLAPGARTVAITVCIIVLPSLLHGNWEAWQIISTAKTARARFGRRLMVPAAPLVLVFALLLEHFWSYIIIFGLPAIRMWATT